MDKKIKFYGSTTIGPKGQLVIPSKLRKELQIKSGDQFIVLKDRHMDSIVIVKAKNIADMLKNISLEVTKISQTLKNKSIIK